jgi:HSP20 family protein
MRDLITWPERIVDDLFGGLYVNKGFSKDLRAHVKEEEDNYLVYSEVPGLKEDELSVEYKDDHLIIKAEYNEENEDTIRTGKYSWSCMFRKIDPEKIDAKLKDGVLKITLPKKEESKPRKIDIGK